MKTNDTIVYSNKELFRYSDIGKQLNSKERPRNHRSKSKRINWFYALYVIAAIIIVALWIFNSNLFSALISIKLTITSAEMLYKNNEALLKDYEERLNVIITEREDIQIRSNELNMEYETYRDCLADKQKELSRLKNQTEELEKKDSVLSDQIKQLQEENLLLNNKGKL